MPQFQCRMMPETRAGRFWRRNVRCLPPPHAQDPLPHSARILPFETGLSVRIVVPGACGPHRKRLDEQAALQICPGERALGRTSPAPIAASSSAMFEALVVMPLS